MYGYELEIKDDATWKEKMNVFKILLPIIQQPIEETGLMNKDEIIKTLIDGTMAEVKKTAGKLQGQFTFFDDSEFYKEVFNSDIFLELINEIAKGKELRVLIEGTAFYMQNFFEKSKNKDINSLYENFIALIKDMLVFDEKNIPKGKDDFTVLNFVYKTDDTEAEGISFANFINSAKDKNYSSIITNKTIDILIDENILNFDSFNKMVTGSDSVVLSELRKHQSQLQYFFEKFIDTKATNKDLRKKFIGFLESNSSADSDSVAGFVMEVLNDVLLEDSPNRNDIKAEWMSKTIEEDSGLSDDEDDGFFN